MTHGICYLVGAGPGDPMLLTLKGRHCLGIADVIVYDYLSNPVFLNYAKEGAELHFVGKKAGRHTLPQPEINALLIGATKSGKIVVRLKGGDPFLFGRGGEEAIALADAGCEFEVVPGVTSAIAGPAYAGIPVTHRDHNTVLTIFTGHEDPSNPEASANYAAIARAPGTKVMLMGLDRLGAITNSFMEAGMDKDAPVALVRWATTGKQETVIGKLQDIAAKAVEASFQPPAIAVFGSVVGLRTKLTWFEKLPLFGKRIAVTRCPEQAVDLVSRLRALGAEAFEMPTIRIEPAPNKREFYETVAYSHAYEWIIFTSTNAVDAFFKAFFEIYHDARDLGAARIAAVGPETAARVRSFRLQVDVQPEKYVAAEIIKALQKETSVENLKILLPRAEGARELLAQELTSLGAIVDDVAAYRTSPETEDVCGGIRRFCEDGADLVTFTSSSTAENFQALNLPAPSGLRYASIGPVTSKTMKKLGMNVDIEAKEHDVPGLVGAIVKFYTKRTSATGSGE